jgi:Ion channel
MSGPSPALGTVLGGILILGAGRDVFDTLFHPEGRATLGRWVMRIVWQLARRTIGHRPRAFSLVGPTALVSVLVLWALLLVVGWALVYWPHLPEGFRVPADEQGRGLVDALHVSLVTLTTLGSGDISPTADGLRLVVPLEALLGFGLLSASISWVLLLYPALSRRRSLAYEIALLQRAERETRVDLLQLEPDAAERMYVELTSRLVAVERDLVSFPSPTTSPKPTIASRWRPWPRTYWNWPNGEQPRPGRRGCGCVRRCCSGPLATSPPPPQSAFTAGARILRATP